MPACPGDDPPFYLACHCCNAVCALASKAAADTGVVTRHISLCVRRQQSQDDGCRHVSQPSFKRSPPHLANQDTTEFLGCSRIEFSAQAKRAVRRLSPHSSVFDMHYATQHFGSVSSILLLSTIVAPRPVFWFSLLDISWADPYL